MRIVVDMQGAQTGDHFSERGRDIISLVRAMVRNRDEHEFILVVNDLLADAIEPIRSAFDELLPQDHIRVFSVIGPVRDDVPENALRRDVAERLREAFLANQRPDVVLVTSLFEGFDEDAVTSIGVLDQNTPTAVLLPPSLPSAENELRHAFCARKMISLGRGGLYLDWPDKSHGEAPDLLSVQRIAAIEIVAASLEESGKKALSALERFAATDDGGKYAEIAVEKTGRFSRSSGKRILLSKLDHRGDFLLAIPAISRLRARYPDAELDIVVGSWNVEAAKGLGLFNKIIPFDYYKSNSGEKPELNPAELSALLERLDSYDIAIDLRRHHDTRFLVAKVSAGLKVGYETRNPEFDSALDIALPTHLDVHFSSTPHDSIHMSTQLVRLIDSLPREPNDYVVLPALTSRVAGDRSNVAIFPTAGLEAREWPIESYAELVQLLSASNLVGRVNVYFASRAEASKAPIGESGKVGVHVGLSFADLMHALSDDAVCVTNNSFGGHIAGYLGLTVIAIYSGHDTVAQWGPPFGDSYVIHRPMPCSPCHLVTREACQYSMQCLDIPVDFVNRKVEEALKSLSTRVPRSRDEANSITTKGAKIAGENIAAHLIQSVAACYGSRRLATPRDSDEVLDVSAAIARSLRPESRVRQLLVDVSELSRHDAKSGIQRVVRSILKEWLTDPPAGYSIEPVYATMDRGYRYARRFTQRFLGLSEDAGVDEPIEYSPGDIFFGLDHQAHVVPAHRTFFRNLRRHGVRVLFLVYDLLAVQMPQYFMPGNPQAIANWLSVVAEGDGAVCISRAVADDLAAWFGAHGGDRQRPFRISWYHNGGDIENSVRTGGLPDGTSAVLGRIRSCPSFLSVGTVEPRKGYAQELAAFDLLWQQGREVCLVIIGSQGWLVDDLAVRLRNHPELNRHLFWLETISDQYLETLYAACTCLLAVSEAEGFGLPLVEAARHKLPVIARDIPVFREIMGAHAFYFSGQEPDSIAVTVDRWLSLRREGKQPKSDTLRWTTWKESAKRLQAIVVGDDCYITIAPTERRT